MESFGGCGARVSFLVVRSLLLLEGLMVMVESSGPASSSPACPLHDFLACCVSLGLDKGLFLGVLSAESLEDCCLPSIVSGARVEVVGCFLGLASWAKAVSESTVSCGNFSTITLGGVLSLASPV